MKTLAATRTNKNSTDPIKPRNALTLLSAEHKQLLSMLREYERSRRTGTRIAKGKLALRICHLLALHGLLKQEIFYPAVGRVLGKKAIPGLTELHVEQTSIRHLIMTLENMSVGNPLFDATVKVLGEQARRHFETEENDLFPQVRRSQLDLAGIGERLAARELELSTRKPGKDTFREVRKVLAA